MSHPQSRILDRLRQGSLTEDRVAPQLPVRRFGWDAAERLERFRERLEAVRGEVHPVGADWPDRVLGLLKARGATSLLYGPGGGAGADLEAAWLAAGAEGSGVRLIPYPEPVESFRDTLFDAVDAGFTGCRGAIAETGTLVLWPDAREPRLLSLVPPIHLVLLDAESIRSTFAELLDEQGWGRGMPTNALLITGPSKSADIEQTLTYGVHGPKELVVLVRVDRPR
jgi:L-lactate dehydrogenase complex protein LldG